MRVNVDSSSQSDPKFKMLGRALGVSWHDARSRCISVWFVCYERRSEVLLPIEVDIAAEMDGFGTAMHQVGLAEPARKDRHAQTSLRIEGVRKRIEFLLKQSAKGTRGGEKSGKARRSRSVAREAYASGAAEPYGSGHPEAKPEAYSPALSPAPDLALAPDLDLKSRDVVTASPRPPPRRSKGNGDPTPEERAAIAVVIGKLAEHSGRGYSAESDGHARLVLRLLRKGYTERDLRMVVWHKANRWKDDPKMDEFLRPKTLFGPENFEDYVVEARAAWEECEREEEAKRFKAGGNGLGKYLAGGGDS